MAQDFESAKKEAPIEPIKVTEGVYKKPVGKTARRQMFVRNTPAFAPAELHISDYAATYQLIGWLVWSCFN